ncbi:MAG TPA: hypothetical protein VIS96_06080 [Terrimicrobiaceae bacterium]
MISSPQRLKTSSDAEQRRPQREAPAPESENLGQSRTPSGDTEQDIPIFCAGGCGEVVGFLPKGHKVLAYKARSYEHWCPTCEAADISKKQCAESKTSFASTDELAGLVKPVRDLRWLRFAQAATVAVIIAGSAFIAMGRVAGIYLAAFGTLAWFATWLLEWKLKD